MTEGLQKCFFTRLTLMKKKDRKSTFFVKNFSVENN